jgi:hypothetical protein
MLRRKPLEHRTTRASAILRPSSKMSARNLAEKLALARIGKKDPLRPIRSPRRRNPRPEIQVILRRQPERNRHAAQRRSKLRSKSSERKVEEAQIRFQNRRGHSARPCRQASATSMQQLSEDARNLTTALRGSAKAQGDWGEFILRDLLEKAGLREGEQYSFQQTFTGVEGENGERSKSVRTDVIVYLPGGRNLIIDSKVSLTCLHRLRQCQPPTTSARSRSSRISPVSAPTFADLVEGRLSQAARRRSSRFCGDVCSRRARISDGAAKRRRAMGRCLQRRAFCWSGPPRCSM